MADVRELLIIGAGPFGLAMAAYARHLGLDCLVVGKPMEFWRSHMPRGLLLRSACDWHLDPAGEATIESYLRSRGLTPKQVEPLSLEFYLGYADWFQQQTRPNILPEYVESLESADHGFEARLENGETLRAGNVVLAIGFGYFQNVPAELVEILPAGKFTHTCDLVDFSGLAGKRCLIIGGRQSAYEWAALLNEAGAAEVHVSHRHETPRFQPSDWSWVGQMVAGMVEDPGWYRRLSPEDRELLNQRFWAEGRLKLEPWLEPRINQPRIRVWPKSQVVSCRDLSPEGVDVRLRSEQREDAIVVDEIILATGYRVDLARVPFLARGDLMSRLETREGSPVLDDKFQSSVPGLYFTSMPAAQDFGPFMAFTVSVGASARVIGSALATE